MAVVVTRRKLVLGAAALAALGAGALAVHLPEEAEGWEVFSEGEQALVTAIGEALFPPGNPLGVSGADVELARRVDELLGVELDPEMTPIFRYVARAVDELTFVSRGARFAALPLEERVDVLRHWDDPDVFPRRAMYDLIRLIFGMAFFNLPEVHAAIGWRSRCALGAA